jgi:hypothetical protein
MCEVYAGKYYSVYFKKFFSYGETNGDVFGKRNVCPQDSLS